MVKVRYFLIGLILTTITMAWIPGEKIGYPMPKMGSDFHAVYVSAAEWVSGRSARFYNEETRYLDAELMSVGGTYQSYGPLSVLMVLPLTYTAFENLRVPVVAIGIALTLLLLFLVWKEIIPDKIQLIFVMLLCMAASAPVHYQIQRANMELIAALLLFPVIQAYRFEKLNWKSYVLLGLAIHLKTWMMIFCLLGLAIKNWKLLILPVLINVGLHLVLHPWFPIQETLASLKATADGTIFDLEGYANISLWSTFKMLGIQTNWQILSAGLFALTAICMLTLKTRRENYLGLILCAGMLSPVLANLYILISGFFLLYVQSTRSMFNIIRLLLVGILMGANTSLHAWDGVMKSVILLVLFVMILLDSRQETKA